MLTQSEILNEVFTLPINEQREIVEKIQKNINQSNGTQKEELSIEERLKIVERLAGSLKMENPPMTKEEVREYVYNLKAEKYK